MVWLHSFLISSLHGGVCVVSLTPQPIYPAERAHLYAVNRRLGGPLWRQFELKYFVPISEGLDIKLWYVAGQLHASAT